ncbi:MAG: UDP-N-acetylmuramoyl-tripeptide--D-alanyl-D-alanine ligase [Nocardioidaceae bacterium]
MITMTLEEVAGVVGGQVADDSGETLVTGAAFQDSRSLVAEGLFVAIVGERVDGHDFAKAAVEAGAAAALVAHPVGAPAVIVDDPVAALGRLAQHVLRLLPGLTVIGITGSQGKTSTKDLLAQILEPHGDTVAPAESFNNEIGVPLTALRATPSTRYLVVEMGARGIGHITYLTSMVRPSVGLVLNVGVAHIGEFGSQDQIAVGKGELIAALPDDGMAVLNADDARVLAMRARTRADVLTFGRSEGVDVALGDVVLDPNGCPEFDLTWRDCTRRIHLPVVGEHQAGNAAAATCVALGLGIGLSDIAAALDHVLVRSHWRMEIVTTPGGVTVVNDAYNANPDSVRAAVSALSALARRQGSGTRTVAVLGEMLELGGASEPEHEALGRLVAQQGLSLLVAVGENARALHEAAARDPSWAGESVWFADKQAAIEFVRGALAPGDVVLVKASRAAGFETVAAALIHDDGIGDGGRPRSGGTGSPASRSRGHSRGDAMEGGA